MCSNVFYLLCWGRDKNTSMANKIIFILLQDGILCYLISLIPSVLFQQLSLTGALFPLCLHSACTLRMDTPWLQSKLKMGLLFCNVMILPEKHQETAVEYFNSAHWYEQWILHFETSSFKVFCKSHFGCLNN